MNIGGVAHQCLGGIAVFQCFALGKVVNSGPDTALDVARHPRGMAVVDNQAGDLLAAYRSCKTGFAGIDLKALVGHDAFHQPAYATGFGELAGDGGKAQGDVIGIAGIAPAVFIGQSADAAVHAQTEGVGDGGAGGCSLRQAAGTQGNIIGFALMFDFFSGRLGA